MISTKIERIRMSLPKIFMVLDGHNNTIPTDDFGVTPMESKALLISPAIMHSYLFDKGTTPAMKQYKKRVAVAVD